MNVIVTNKYDSELKSLNIDIIKAVNGNFDSVQLGTMFQNFFFQKMILDITAINDYQNISNIDTLARFIDISKVIILLDRDEASFNNDYINKLSNIGVFNVALNKEEILKLLEHPNTKPINLVNNNNYSVGNVYNEGASYNQMVVTSTNFSIPKQNQYQNNTNNMQNQPSNQIMNNNLNQQNNQMTYNNLNQVNNNNQNYVNNPNQVSNNNQNSTNNLNQFFNNNQNFNNQNINNQPIVENNNFPDQKNKRRIIGFKSITSNAGSTTLIYMLKKELSNKYRVLCAEIYKQDFRPFKDNEMVSISEDNLEETVESSASDIVLLDVNESTKALEYCDKIIYLIEPSTIKLYKMLLTHRNTINTNKDAKIILNKSMLSNSMVGQFQSEMNLKVSYVLPPLNERDNNSKILNDLISKVVL